MHRVVINGWRFDFSKMIAEVVHPHWKAGFGLTEISYRMFYGSFEYEICRWCSTRGWVKFFDVPEHKYNDKILEAYKSYIAEKELLT